MKKIFNITLPVIILFIGMATQAQETKFGVKLGGNLSTIEGRDVDFSIVKPKLGFQLGGTADIAFSNNFYVLTGLEMTRKGYKLQDDADTTTYRLMYL
ncbi:MAG: PorT family protein, partial [Bacteroidales bacterium]|nr:PorT family protein [Bacteroidales bacterium]